MSAPSLWTRNFFLPEIPDCMMAPVRATGLHWSIARLD